MPEILTNDHTSDVVTVLTRRCFVCDQQSVVTLDRAAFAVWDLGAPVQDAFPDMPVPERELLISGTHPACWDTL